MTKEFYSNGKLLLSGEYAVLDGAYAWAVPTKFGQSMTVTEDSRPQLHWRSYDEKGGVWFEAIYKLHPLGEISTTDLDTSITIINILKQAQILNSQFLVGPLGFEVASKMDFPRNWGLGSSSTLINNIANWAEIDPYTLLSKTFGGSGYDIASAQLNLPILYHLKKGVPIATQLKESVPFADALYFIYLNQKQNSREAISLYNNLAIDKKKFVQQVSTISKKMTAAQNIQDFEVLIHQHEREISKAIGLETVQSQFFQDYWGAIKSLGAWGGDFILATGNEKTPDYFKEKGYETIIPYSQMVLS